VRGSGVERSVCSGRRRAERGRTRRRTRPERVAMARRPQRHDERQESDGATGNQIGSVLLTCPPGWQRKRTRSAKFDPTAHNQQYSTRCPFVFDAVCLSAQRAAMPLIT